MKTLACISIVLFLTVQAVEAGGLPWPTVAEGKLYLPFGLQWFMEGAREHISAYGEPECDETSCRWMVEKPEGTVIFHQAYHYGSLVGFRMDYMLKRDDGLIYRDRMEQLKAKLSDWIVTLPADPLMPMLSRNQSFKAESMNTRMMASYHEGEYTVTVILDFHAK